MTVVLVMCIAKRSRQQTASTAEALWHFCKECVTQGQIKALRALSEHFVDARSAVTMQSIHTQGTQQHVFSMCMVSHHR